MHPVGDCQQNLLVGQDDPPLLHLMVMITMVMIMMVMIMMVMIMMVMIT